MPDDELTLEWRTLEPSPQQRRRMEARVTTWLEAHDASLADEWLSLLRVSPIRTIGLVAASAVAMLAATPVLWLARAFL